MKKIEFVLNLRPISINSFYGHHGHRKYITAKGQEWRDYIRFHLRDLINKGSITPFDEKDRLEVKYVALLKGRRKFDTANIEKALTDTLEGFLFDNDEVIDRISIERIYSDHDEIQVTITELDSKALPSWTTHAKVTVLQTMSLMFGQFLRNKVWTGISMVSTAVRLLAVY